MAVGLSSLRSLPATFQPQAIQLPITDSLNEFITAAHRELTAFAQKDSNNCWGYFPALTGKNKGLSAARGLHQKLPSIQLADKDLKLNFLRLSLVQQTGDSPYHMDSDSKTALTGDVSTIDSRLVWRLLLNLSAQHSRNLGYLDIDTATVSLTTEGGYIHYTGIVAGYERTVTLPPRTSANLHGVLFCASRVLHTGKDDRHGHFVAGYGCEEFML